MARRKTIKVEVIKKKINAFLSFPDVDQKEKKALCVLLEGVLFDTGNYRGFQHVYWCEKGYQEWVDAGEVEGPEKNKFIVGDRGEWSRTYI
jgi:hypothetical protein